MSMKNTFQKYKLTTDQLQLVDSLNVFLNSNEANIFLLKGYAGTGKTFIMKGLSEYLYKVRRNFVIAAPTGKAARIIREKTGVEHAYTIHKTIYCNKAIQDEQTNLVEYTTKGEKTYKFYYDLKVNDNSVDTVYIIDEASMISNIYSEMEFIRFGSGFLLQDLLKFINLDNNDHNKKVIFIGDNAQLPPVNMSFSPALDAQYLKEKFGLNVSEFELTEVVRQKENSGILKNSTELRNSLKKETFNTLDINTSYDDVNHIDNSDFLNKYIEVSKNKISKNAMVLAYKNATVKEQNQTIRNHFFKDSPSQISVKDKVIILKNIQIEGTLLLNGDFGMIDKILSNTECKTITLKRKDEKTKKVEEIKIDLYFKDVILLVKDIKNKVHKIESKIIENLLFSENAGLSSDENKAIYLDFRIRHPKLKPGSKEFKDAIMGDSYFNAIQVKFGYAITCHKAQGGEWENIFVDCSYTQSQLSKNYFRWLYTAMTRASNTLYVMNKPHIGIFDKLKNKDLNLNSIQDEVIVSDSIVTIIANKINDIIADKNIEIISKDSKQYQETYCFEKSGEFATINIYYSGKNTISAIKPHENNDLAKLLLELLIPLKKTIIVSKKSSYFTFAESFLEDFYSELKSKVSAKNINIDNIKHTQYKERYSFSENDKLTAIDFYYNGKKQFTNREIVNGSNQELFDEIIELI